MAEIKGGELILRCLQQEGVKRIIGITDEGYHAIQHKCADMLLDVELARSAAASILTISPVATLGILRVAAHTVSPR